MNAEQINEQLRATQVNFVLYHRQYEGMKQLFDAAAFAGDGKECARIREQLHSIVDAQLDSSSAVMVLTRRLLELGTSSG